MLRNVIYEVVKRFPGLSRTHLLGILYLVDREYYRRMGVTLTGLRYILGLYLPTASEINCVYYDLCDDDLIIEVFDGSYYRIRVNDKIVSPVKFSGDVLDVFESVSRVVLDSDGKLKDPESVVRYIFSLDEVKEAELFSEIRFHDGM